MSEEIEKLDTLKIKIVAGLEFINNGMPFHKIDLNDELDALNYNDKEGEAVLQECIDHIAEHDDPEILDYNYVIINGFLFCKPLERTEED